MINISYSELGLISRQTAESMIRGSVTFDIDGLDVDDFSYRLHRLLKDEWGLFCVRPHLVRKYCVVLFEKLTAEAKISVLGMIKDMQADIKPTTTQ